MERCNNCGEPGCECWKELVKEEKKESLWSQICQGIVIVLIVVTLLYGAGGVFALGFANTFIDRVNQENQED